MQDKWLSRILLRKRLIDLRLSPKRLNLRFTFDRIGPHIKLGLGKVNGFFITSGFSQRHDDIRVAIGLGFIIGGKGSNILSRLESDPKYP